MQLGVLFGILLIPKLDADMQSYGLQVAPMHVVYFK